MATSFFTGWLAEGIGVGSAFVENTAAGYARQAITLAPLVNGTTYLASGVTFSGTTTPFVVTQRALYDQATGGDLLQFWNLHAPVPVQASGTDTLAAGALRNTYPQLNLLAANMVLFASGMQIGTTSEGAPIMAGTSLSFFVGN